MTNSTVMIHRYSGGMYGIIPAADVGALSAAPGPGTMVLEVLGGHLVWNVLAAQEVPAALIAEADLAQEWVWAVYGEAVALAVDDLGSDAAGSAEVPALPGSPAPAVSVRRLAYAHWASRWWPASTLDGIAALDPVLLDRDIAVLTEECESLLDGSDFLAPLVPTYIESLPRASDYALAAGDESGTAGTLVLARGTGGWDWRRCPPGLVDASESAVSWQLIRHAGATTVAVNVAAHPELPADIPAHLRPWAHIDTGRGEFDTELRAADDTWIGESDLATTTSAVRITIHVPGFGPIPDTADALSDTEPTIESAATLRRRIREFATSRLRRAASPAAEDDAFPPLLAEIAAANGDSDF
ncbi:hypothetical protein [Nocardia seriolae]|uniref:hypothetical protein n=1 Tax=Nocardia seriolae TaxID=37332 RepID=UPI0008FF632B|nr:hypothetical protein [Nocardia seriolae]OJF82008.1 hypothetical protein NS14008_26110 [Nocardia seriolae]PSK28003.1 hypothetical protein C6575_28850 [Nocardia seriolae]QOW33907.1 hypothetical protein IMZ23_01740 [Nocardia seriolae]QUN18599.1 hypothetical protein KEC46_03995 [Nocardia seriolae]WNJ61110.1 hypothetical protein RMO66_10650 [Nocardia seriolae]